MASTSTAMTSQTLAQRLSQGRIPVSEALRYSMMLADALRRLHESGRVHGAVSPSAINLTGTAIELMPAPPIDSATAYKSPEVLDGHPADARSDIFSFGAVVYELLSGKRAFEGSERGSMAPSGSPAVDRLVSGCVAVDPAARIQRIQKVMLELKLLAASAARASAPLKRDPAAEAQLRGELDRLEARMAGRIDATEKALSEIQTAVTGILHKEPEPLPDFAMRGDMQEMEARLAGRLDQIEARIHSLQEQTEGRLSGMVAQLEERLAAAMTRIETLEKTESPAIEQVRHQVAELHNSMAEDFQNFEKSLHGQSAAIDSARTALAQTDDLVERVVEALESLQATVLEYSEEHSAVVN